MAGFLSAELFSISQSASVVAIVSSDVLAVSSTLSRACTICSPNLWFDISSIARFTFSASASVSDVFFFSFRDSPTTLLFRTADSPGRTRTVEAPSFSSVGTQWSNSEGFSSVGTQCSNVASVCTLCLNFESFSSVGTLCSSSVCSICTQWSNSKAFSSDCILPDFCSSSSYFCLLSSNSKTISSGLCLILKAF